MDQELKEILGSILGELGKVNTKLDALDTRIGSLETRVGSLEIKMDALETRLDAVEIKQGEIFIVVKAIEHSNQIHKAEIDNLSYRVANTEGIMTGIGEVIQKSAV